MSNGNHFVPGVYLSASPSFTGSDADTAVAALQLAASRGLIFIGASAPTSVESPDWERLLWAEPYDDNGTSKYTLKMYNSTDDVWYPVLTHLPDIYISDIKAEAADLGKVPVVTQVGLDYVPQWTTFVPSNIPASALTPGSANQLIITNNSGTACIWSSLANLLASLGRVVSLDNLTIGAATAGQVPTYTGGTIKWQTPYAASTPIADNLAWVAANNNLEVWDTQNAKTVLKSRKQFLDTIPSDVSDATISGTTKIFGFDTSGATPVSLTTTVSAIKDYVLTDVTSLLATKPSKFYSTLYDLQSATTTCNNGDAAALFAGIPHGLGARPAVYGARIVAKTANGSGGIFGSATRVLAVGESFNPQDVSIRCSVSTTSNVSRLCVTADATNLYLYEIVTSTNFSSTPSFAWSYALSSGIDPNNQKQIQLYAIL